MKIVLAPDSFKGSASASRIAAAMERGIRRACPDCQILKLPLADGGEGTAARLIELFDAELRSCQVSGPLASPVEVNYGLLDGHTAIFDVASIVGLDLLPESARDPLQTGTYGIGELILTALDKGARDFIIGLGGSSTNDGGIGMLQALGVACLDEKGQAVSPNGAGLCQLSSLSIDQMDPRLATSSFTILTDVNNPLLGKDGASYVYGGQKGGSPAQLARLEKGMETYASLIRQLLQLDVTKIAGGGAAGGLGVAFTAFLKGRLTSGIDYMMEAMELKKHVADADLVLTGEGKIDDQTLKGKTIYGLAQLAKTCHTPVVALCASNHLKDPTLYEAGIQAVFSIMQEPMSFEAAVDAVDTLIEATVENIIRLYG